ncbi:hypothetical protein BDV96DRAFT_81257 [Lophiotrema nucula]|uniref:Cora-like Mg2+ transporter protein-domain-containing protein n=1 Tax=Lophiotrema nucula TaxID=690887 RepID=A0A6A5Z989_9PLEO|nr:hypothetical protein BDV96DRAFT_81257 [Lophiotrema nucula]
MKRSRSDPPPPITVEDTASGTAPQPSPSPTRMTEQARSFSAYEPRPKPVHNDSFLRERKRTTWGHKRQRSPGVEWHEKWTKDSWRNGRVLLIDYVNRAHTGEGRRKILAKEFWEIDGLKKYYENQNYSHQAALRVIHVQNAPWATRFLLRKFNIDASDDLVGTSFGRWAQYARPKRRGGKPVLSGKTFRAQKDPWRGISRTAFGLDYLRSYEKKRIADSASGMKMMELNNYDLNDQACYAHDVYAQRLSVYVQFSDGQPALPVDPDIRNPYNDEEYQNLQHLKRQYGSMDLNGNGEKYVPKLGTLDNSSTIILFEHSQSGSVEDTLIGARQEIEQRWRRLTFYLSKEDTEDDASLAVGCMDFVLRDIFKALSYSWEKHLGISETHVGILEDKIYENPADESRAPELWTNSALWLKVERLMYIHSDIVKEMRNHLKEVIDGDPREDEHWLVSSSEELEKLTTQFQEGVVKPTANLSDLMYKSVGIRDARHSLQLGLSMWRLSWITFIFLPLTFVSGFFGMNVDTFENNPSIKWWFISTIPLFTLVVTGWYGVKHTLSSQRQNTLRRGVYESLYTELSEHHPTLWSRRGPRDGVVPVGWWSNVKWRLVTTWFAPDRTIAARGYDAGDEELGVWSRVKRSLVKRWLGGLRVLPVSSGAAAADSKTPDLESAIQPDLGALGELLSLATPLAMADADPAAAARLQKRTPLERFRSLSPTRSAKSEAGRPSTGRKSDDGNSGVMVDEKSEDEKSGDEAERERESTFSQRLNVPLYPGGAGIVAGGL